MMLKYIYVIGLGVGLLFLLPSPVFAQSSCATLTRTLKQGSVGEDVRLLQQVLNRDTRTQVSASGVGSKGNETTTFGAKTREAVVRFQELYKNDVLSPAGLTRGTGIVGSLSRAKISVLCSSGSSITSSSSGTTRTRTRTTPSTAAALPIQNTVLQNNNDPLTPVQNIVNRSAVFTPTKVTTPWMGDGKFPTPVIIMLSDTIMKPGDHFTVMGVGFTSDTPNSLSIGDNYTITNLSVDSSGLISFKVPADVPKGRHYLTVNNKNGMSNKTVFAIVPTPGREGPSVRIGVPNKGKPGDTVTVYGKGFATTWNDIHFPTAIIRGVKSVDGNTLTFTIPPPEYKLSANDLKFVPDISSQYFIINDYGVSGATPFTVTFK